jgi:prophage maintenance system killer protein
MSHLHYLTVQDMLWINLEVTKKVQHFNYAKLEEATYYQYSYGESTSLLPQAGRFLTGFLRLHPFEAGNESTGLIGCVSFLAINGQTLTLKDEEALDWLDRVMTRQVTGVEAVQGAAKPDPEFHEALKPDVRTAIRSVLCGFPRTVAELANRSATAK